MTTTTDTPQHPDRLKEALHSALLELYLEVWGNGYRSPRMEAVADAIRALNSHNDRKEDPR